MSRYIDADKVKEYILSTGFYCDTEADRKYSAGLIDELFPTADVVAVVRCKDCKWFKSYGSFGDCHNPVWGDGWANYPSPTVSEDGFCSYGEKR